MAMKIRNTKVLIYVIVVVILMCGCNKGVSPAQNPSNEAEEMRGVFSKDNYAIYELDSAESQFNMTIIENVIDEAYAKEIASVSTTGEMVQTEINYISIWQNELDSTIAKYIDVLSDEDREKFKKSQIAFDEFVKTSFDFESEILLQNKYDIHMGTSSNWLLYVERREAIRERTIHVKYLHFLLEYAMDKEEYASLTFDSYRGQGDGS